MEASQSAKAKNITARTLDGTVKRISADGDQQTISMKCLDINPAVLEYLGVSKPILNYVTFCHQVVRIPTPTVVACRSPSTPFSLLLENVGRV